MSLGSEEIKRILGVYEVQRDAADNPGYYKHIDGGSFIYRKDGKWTIGRGPSETESTAILQADRNSDQLPLSEWNEVKNSSSKKSKEDFKIRVFSIPDRMAENVLKKKEYWSQKLVICQTKEGNWRFLEETDEKRCNWFVDCKLGADEQGCPYQERIAKANFLIVSGTSHKLDGVYENKNSKDYQQINGTGMVIPSKNRWKIANRDKWQDLTSQYTSKESEEIPSEGWMRDEVEDKKVKVAVLPKSVNRTLGCSILAQV